MAMKGLVTCGTPLIMSHKPTNTVRHNLNWPIIISIAHKKKEFDGAQINGPGGIWPSKAKCRWLPKTLIAHTHLLARQKSFWKKLLKIAAIKDYRQRRSVGKVHFSWFILHGPWLFLCVRLLSSRFCFVMRYFLPRELKICLMRKLVRCPF